LVPPNYLSRNKNHIPTTGIDHGLTIDRRIYPIRANPAVNRGYIPGTLDSKGRLLEFTAACSPLVFRGVALPADYQGNVFVCEPSGNLIKRNVVEKKGFMVSAADPHAGKEFLASTDERFRPVALATGADGALYVADMYRGLVQHGAYVTPYLREQTLKRNLIQPINRGRIWRIVPKDWKSSKPKKLSQLSLSELVAHLANPDGWQRDMAQRLLVEQNDPQSVAMLVKVATEHPANLARFHALWTLEGLQWKDSGVLLKCLQDADYQVSNVALRMIEPLVRNDEKLRRTLAQYLLTKANETSPEQTLQMALSARVLEDNQAFTLLNQIIDKNKTSPLMRDAVMSSLSNREYLFLEQLLASKTWQNHDADKEIFLEILTTAVIRKNNHSEMSGLLAMLSTKTPAFDWRQKTILTAMAIQSKNRKLKPVLLDTTPALFDRMDFEKPLLTRLRAAALLYQWPGAASQPIYTTQQTLLNEDEQRQFALGRQHYLSTCAGCHGTDGEGLNRFGPPLTDSQWVLGDEKRLALIVLHGIEGPIEVGNKLYDVPDILPVMPSHSTMDDAAMTAVLTYIRNEWGNAAGAMNRATVSKTRHTSQGRVVPWTVKELNQHLTVKP